MRCREASTTGAMVTVKVMLKSHESTFRAEAETLARIHNKDRANQSLCIRILEHFDWKGHHCLVLEGVGMSLRSFMDKYFCTSRGCRHGFALLHVSVFTRQLLQAVTFMHDAKLVHMDLKPDNICLANMSSGVITDPNGCKSPRHMYIKGLSEAIY